MKIEALDLREARVAMQVESDLRAAESRAIEKSQETAKVSAALDGMMYQLGGLDPEDPRFKRITSATSRRDLTPVEHERMQLACLYLSTRTPFGKRIPELISDFVVGESITATAEDESVQVVLDRFWKDPVNRMEKTVKEYCEELSKLGEICVPVSVNPVDGFVRLGYIDPLNIDYIEHGLLQTGDNSQDICIPVAVRLRRQMGETEGRRLSIVHLDEDPYSPTFGQLVGDCFYEAINKSKMASRGISDLYCVADWIDVLDQIVFDAADRVRFMNTWLWHFVVNGADDKALQDFKTKVLKSPPRQGGSQFTNEQVTIKAISPDFKSYEFGETITNLKFYGLGGLGFPGHWFADPTDANRATAAVMDEPTKKKLTERQRVVKAFVTNVVNFVLMQAVAHGVISESASLTWNLQVPDLSPKDLSAGATTLGTLVNPLVAFVNEGWIRAETAARAAHLGLSQIGIDVDSKEEFEAAQLERQNRQALEANVLNDQKNLAEALNKLQQPGMVQ